MAPTWRGVASGLVALLAGLGVGELVAGLAGSASPVADVGQWVIDHVPKVVREWAIATFGTADKAVLVAGILVVLAGLAAGLGVLALRRLGLALGAVGLVGVAGAAAALDRPQAGVADALPSLVGALAAGGALALLTRAATERVVTPARAAQVPGAGADRRTFLWTGAGIGAAAALAGSVGRLLQQGSAVAAARAQIVLPSPARPAPPVPAAAQAPGAVPYLTPNDGFYRIDLALRLPQIDHTDWKLRIKGMVDRPFELTYDELLRRPLVEQVVTLQCVSNELGGGLVGNARWLGVPLAELLDEAGVQPGATQVYSQGAEGFSCGTPVGAARRGLVALGMNGEVLPIAHGFPARLVVPGLYGYVSATKWVYELELTTWDREAYWVRKGWAQQAPIKTASRIEAPRPSEAQRAGPIVLAGTAWAPGRGIAAVDVRIDGGPWQPANLAPTVSDEAWTQWWLAWSASPGEHRVQVRAVDGDGVPQIEEPSPPLPDGATGLHTVTYTVMAGDR